MDFAADLVVGAVTAMVVGCVVGFVDAMVAWVVASVVASVVGDIVDTASVASVTASVCVVWDSSMPAVLVSPEITSAASTTGGSVTWETPSRMSSALFEQEQARIAKMGISISKSRLFIGLSTSGAWH